MTQQRLLLHLVLRIRYEVFCIDYVFGQPVLFGPIPQNRDAVIHLFEMPPPCFGQGEDPKRQEPDIAPEPRSGAHPPGANGTSRPQGLKATFYACANQQWDEMIGRQASH